MCVISGSDVYARGITGSHFLPDLLNRPNLIGFKGEFETMSNHKQTLFKEIPSVDRLLSSRELEGISNDYPRSLILKAINQTLDQLRMHINQGRITQASELNLESVQEQVIEKLRTISLPSLRPVINGAGVVVHTNLGRSILAEKVLAKFRLLAGGYSNLEYDISEGRRGSRYMHVEDILKELTSAEAAMVVNNNAAAVLISLETLGRGREVVVSRGQLVEIGGSFRIPAVMRKSGAKMVEVGTTNKTHLWDYEEVIGPETALLLKVHTSNYQVVGFTEEVPLSGLVELGKRHGIPVMEDLGSGCFVDFSKYGLSKEPPVQETLAQGVDLVTFSGDKLLGGPQAGIILGRKDIIEAIKKNPLTRALRIDKLTLMALEETLRMYRDERTALREIPTLRMICQSYKALVNKAERLIKLIGKIKTTNFALELVDGISRPGGGALPLSELPSRLLSIVPKRLSSRFIESWLRSYDPPIIGRLEKDRILLDLRTIQRREMKKVAQAVKDLAHLDQE
jgi:L-seryl-tRNA(Ser) seleniumtransferase